MSAPLVVVMGVAGAGKSAVGEALAAFMGVRFVDGDALHPPTNIAKMSSGQPLVDDDRWPWLASVGGTLANAQGEGMVLACSALKVAYRDAIRQVEPATFFVHLTGTTALIAERLGERSGHFMPTALLDSQLAALEPLVFSEAGATIDIAAEITAIIPQIAAVIGTRTRL